MEKKKTYYAEWQIPDAMGMMTHQLSGTLSYYGDKPSVLELIFKPNSGSFSINGYYDVIWGQDAGGGIYSLFGVSLEREQSFSKTTYIVRFILIGKHVKSLDESCFDTCWVKYKYLNHWALDNRFAGVAGRNETIVSFDIGARPAFLSVEIEEGLRLMLWGHITDILNRYEITATQYTNLNIDTRKNASLNTYLKTISEFSRFLSIALFAEQHPSEIIFANKGLSMKYSLLFDTRQSVEPYVFSLIKYEVLKERMPDILIRWHSSYDQIAPICKYLIRSINSADSFDAPDFLIVAQALDGYFKRFVNHRDNKNTKQYKHQIEKLLKVFKNVDVIRTCSLDADILTQTRHKYSHLIPDDDKEIAKAVEGRELYYLTQKCVVLLTCCILDYLGLTTEEINQCCKNSPIEQIVESIPFL